jgi:hypothetical protein
MVKEERKQEKLKTSENTSLTFWVSLSYGTLPKATNGVEKYGAGTLP